MPPCLPGPGPSSWPPVVVALRLVPGQGGAFLPVLFRGLGQGGQLLQLLRGELELGGGQVGLQLVGGDGAGEDDVGPGVGEHGGQGDGVGADVVGGGDAGEGVGCRAAAVGGQAAVGDRLLDDHAPAGAAGLGQGPAGRGFQEVPGGLDAAEGGLAGGGELQGAADGRGLGGAAGGQADLQALVAEAGQLVQDRPVLKDAAVEGGRVDLVEVEVVAEQGSGLGRLAGQGGEGVVLDLVGVGVHAPVADVGVAPFGADGDLGRVEVAGAQPGGEELLGPAVGAGRVQVADAGGVGGVQDLVAAALQGLDVAVGAEVAAAAQVDVGGAAEGGQAEPERADLQAGRAEGAGLHRRVRRWPATSRPTGGP